jgi:drug/metabolite transporter (DMT)-like permease
MRPIVLIAIGILSLLWGSSFIPIKNIVDVINPLIAFGLRFTIAGLSLVIIHYILHIINNRRTRKKDIQGNGKDLNKKRIKEQSKAWILSGLFFIVGGQGLLSWGAPYLSSGETALINSTIPIWIALLALFLYKAIPTKLTTTGIAAGFIGLIILVLPTIDQGESHGIGIVLLVLSSICWGLGSLYSRPVDETTTGKRVLVPTGMFMIIGGILLIIVAIFTGASVTSDIEMLLSAKNGLLISFLYLTLVCTAIGYATFYWLLESTTPSLANTFAYIVPMVAVFLGWALLNESISIATLVATGVISGGVALMIIGPSSFTPSYIHKKPTRSASRP